MIKKVTITKVYKSTTNKNGEAYMIKNGEFAGQPFTRIGIQTDKHGTDTYYNNAKATDKAMSLEEGQSLLLDFTEEPNADGSNTWKNFKFPTKKEIEEFAIANA
mgnify:CR=1 FL=1